MTGMDVQSNLASLKAIPWTPPGGAQPERIEDIEARWGVTLPGGLKALLQAQPLPIAFDAMIRFVPAAANPWAGRDGKLGLDLLYGAVGGDYGLNRINETFLDNIPGHCFVIGASGGGNQICLDRKTGALLFWDHEALTDAESLFRIADGFDAFVALLEAEEDAALDTSGIVESESWLDF